MNFIKYITIDKKQNYTALIIILVFTALYLMLNFPYITFMSDQESLLQRFSPFYGVPFTLNIFNFDPSLYYSFNNGSVVHPFINFLTVPLAYAAKMTVNNSFFLILQSVINAMSASVFFIYLCRQKVSYTYAVIFTLIFGSSSYLIFTSLIPDSYCYAQFGLLVSILYLQYCRTHDNYKVIPIALFGFLNFAITSTNIVPFFIAVFISVYKKKELRNSLLLVLKIGVTFILTTILFSFVQYILFDGHTWFEKMGTNLNNAGFSYVAPFSLQHHWKAFYMLFVSPILTPSITLIDQGIVAFATDITADYSIYSHLLGIVLLISGAASIFYRRKEKDTWTLMSFVLFAVFLHLGIGYGLGAFKYDLYLYAGHYLFAQLLIIAQVTKIVNHKRWNYFFMVIMVIILIITITNNVILHSSTLEVISNAYLQM